MKTKDKKNNDKKEKCELISNNIKFICTLLAILILVIVICISAYAKFITRTSGTAAVQVADFQCTLQVDTNTVDDNSNIINPCCEITVRNFDDLGDADESNDKVTQTDVRYKLNINIKEDYEYYLKQVTFTDADGSDTTKHTATEPQEGMTNQQLQGTFAHNGKQTTTFTIVFVNPGDIDVDELVKVELIANQDV